MRRVPVFAGLVAMALSGCGQPLLGDTFRGAPVWSTRANVQVAGDGVDTRTDLRLSLFYSRIAPGSPGDDDPEKWVEHPGTTFPVVAPSDNQLEVFEPPGADLMAHSSDGASLGYAFGRLLVYADTSGDGRRQPGEPFLGIDPPPAYLYVPSALSADRTPTHGALAPGFSWITLPQPCGDPAPGPRTPGNCGVPLGAACIVDGDCGGGRCLKETKVPWPAGYCTIVEPPAKGCRPGDGVYMRRQQFSPAPPGAQGFWLKRCATSADCVRLDRDKQLYVCDPGLLACVPALANGVIPVGGRFEVEPFCARDVTR